MAPNETPRLHDPRLRQTYRDTPFRHHMEAVMPLPVKAIILNSFGCELVEYRNGRPIHGAGQVVAATPPFRQIQLGTKLVW